MDKHPGKSGHDKENNNGGMREWWGREFES